MIACFHLPEIGIAVERSRLPDLWGTPICLTDAGVVVGLSSESAVCGIVAGQQLSGARTLCPNLRSLPYDAAAYRVAAEQVWDILALESSTVEPASPEICFLVVDESIPQPTQRVHELACRLAAAMRIPVYACIAPSKLVAEYAVTLAASPSKSHPATNGPVGAHVIDVAFGREAATLASCPLSRVPRLDTLTRERLARLGITRLGDLAAARIPVHRLSRTLRAAGHLLTRLARGIDDDPVKPLWPPARIERSIDFETDADSNGNGIVLLEPLHAALQRLASCIADKLCARCEYCRILCLKTRYEDGSMSEREEKLAMPSADAKFLARAAVRLLGRSAPEQPVTALSLSAGELSAGSGMQLTLLDPCSDEGGGDLYPHERRCALDAATRYIRKRWGPGALLSASLLTQARKIRLWTYPLGSLTKEVIEVDCDGDSSPVRYRRTPRRRSQRSTQTTCRITRIHDRWKEREWFWGASFEHSVYRVDSDPGGTVEMHCTGERWSLTAHAD